jgi:hypothetical protein
MSEYLSKEDQALVNEYDKNYEPGVVIVKRVKPPVTMSKKVNVYVDGILQTMDEDRLNHLIDSGFYIVVTRKP